MQEPFRAGQKGSSAMPHKRNPIKAEQISGLARVLRANAQAALENVALWHERDISHSSVERVILPDSTILLDYLQHRAMALVEGMTVDAERMRENLELTHGALFSQRVLLALVGQGMARDDAYRVVQELAQRAWDEGIALRELLAGDERVAPLELDLDEIFSYDHYVRYAHEIVGRLDERARAHRRDRLSRGRPATARVGSIEASDDARRPAPNRQREGARDVRPGGARRSPRRRRC